MNLKERLLFLLIPLTLLPLVFVVIVGFFLFQKMTDLSFIQPYIHLALVFIGVIAVSTVVMAVAIAHSISLPIKTLTRITDGIAKGNLEATLDTNFEIKEIGHLAASIEQMKNEIKHQQEIIRKEAASAAVGKLVSHVAHDLAGPLSSVETALANLRATEVKDKKSADALHLLELSAKRLKAISNDLLDKQKGDKPEKSLFSLQEILDELIREYELQEMYQCVQFTKQYPSRTVHLYGDRPKMERAFANLIKNGVEAMDKCGQLTVTARLSGDEAEVAVQDTGCGMSGEILNKVLDGGFTTAKENGHGIGMSVVRKILEEHGGSLRAESEIGIGTTFQVRLPLPKIVATPLLCKEGLGEVETLPHPNPPLTKGREGYKVLVIDDEQMIRLAWEVIQKKLHIEELYCHPNLESLLEAKLDLNGIDIAFVDKNIRNSQYSGAEVVNFLKSKGVSKVVLASGENEEELREDPQFSQADFITCEKIPQSFKEFFS